jgi:hypothetical protein
MSFLDTNSAEFISAKITQNGRKAIAKGAFNIKFFQIGDSEYDYNYSGFTGLNNTKAQIIFSPLDKDTHVKYPYKLSDETNSTTFGVPIDFSKSITIRNAMPPAGMVSNRETIGDLKTAEIYTYYERISFSYINGTNQLQVSTGSTYSTTNFITIFLDELGGVSPDKPIINKNVKSLNYRILSITGNTLVLDRLMPNYSTVTGYTHILRNNAENEYYEIDNIDSNCLPKPLNNTQLNPWTVGVVWSEKLFGSDVGSIDESIFKYDSNIHVSTKNLLGYTSNSGQTFIDKNNLTLTNPTSYKNDFGEIINVLPNEQRCIAVVHFSEKTNMANDPELFYRYDDFISTLTDENDTITVDENGDNLTDNDYFEVYLPFLMYHRQPTTTIGALFKMDTEDYYITSPYNLKHKILFRYLLDELGNKVGKVFPNHKIFVFDDQEIVASLDYKSNRNFTLNAPSIILSNVNNCDVVTSDFLTEEMSGKTLHVTYLLSNLDTASSLNFFPCNYITKLKVNDLVSNLTIRFSDTSFNFMSNNPLDIKTKFLAKKIKVLIQETDNDEQPQPDLWKVIDVTTQIGNDTYLDVSKLRTTPINITKTLYDNATFFDLETLMGSNYLGDDISDSVTQFGEKAPFPGSVRLVRASNIEEMSFLINLPATQFLTTQNPSYKTGDKKITEICLLNEYKELMVVAKLAKPIKRVGTQILNVKLDF